MKIQGTGEVRLRLTCKCGAITIGGSELLSSRWTQFAGDDLVAIWDCDACGQKCEWEVKYDLAYSDNEQFNRDLFTCSHCYCATEGRSCCVCQNGEVCWSLTNSHEHGGES